MIGRRREDAAAPSRRTVVAAVLLRALGFAGITFLLEPRESVTRISSDPPATALAHRAAERLTYLT